MSKKIAAIKQQNQIMLEKKTRCTVTRKGIVIEGIPHVFERFFDYIGKTVEIIKHQNTYKIFIDSIYITELDLRPLQVVL